MVKLMSTIKIIYFVSTYIRTKDTVDTDSKDDAVSIADKEPKNLKNEMNETDETSSQIEDTFDEISDQVKRNKHRKSKNRSNVDVRIPEGYTAFLKMKRKGKNMIYEYSTTNNENNDDEKALNRMLSYEKFEKNLKNEVSIDESNSVPSFLYETFISKRPKKNKLIEAMIPKSDNLEINYDGNHLCVKTTMHLRKYTMLQNSAVNIFEKLLAGNEEIKEDEDDEQKENEDDEKKEDEDDEKKRDIDSEKSKDNGGKNESSKNNDENKKNENEKINGMDSKLKNKKYIEQKGSNRNN